MNETTILGPGHSARQHHPSVEGSISYSFESKQESKSDYFTGVEASLRVFRDIFHLIIDTAEQFCDKTYYNHGVHSFQADVFSLIISLTEPRDSSTSTIGYYVLRTGCQWKAIPRCPAAAGTVHLRFKQWREAGVFMRLRQEGLITYDELKGLDWEWQAMDGAMTKAPLGGDAGGRNPTDRGKKGVKKSILTEGNGMPIGVAIDGANRHDKKLVRQTLENIVVKRPDPEEKKTKHMSG